MTDDDDPDGVPWTRLLGAGERLPAGLALPIWYARLRVLAPPRPTIAAAMVGGHAAPSPGLAFLAGYQAALRVLWPAAPDELGALCVTEGGSVRPADLTTRLVGDRVDGRKDFVTAGDAARWWLCAAREEAVGERPRLALVIVRAGAPGCRVDALPAIPWLPEVGHARLHLGGAPCERLAGDGWDDYVRPFRTIEDLHVFAAIVAWLHHVGLAGGWPGALLLRLAALLAGAAALARMSPAAATTHVLLAGQFAALQALEGDLEAAFAAGPAAEAALWARERRILGVAAGARAKRLGRALTALGREATT